ncbi:heavy metal transporter [Microbacterium paludicola]|uniref:heavy metal transporter n=1 Tax=Microbacterium paludicola TaxID=300019 RepID=UPI00119F8EF3|nr:heavy metal transporter [Microbacterium paludicola]
MTTPPPRRVRVTADTPATLAPAPGSRAQTRGIALPGSPVDDADAVYSRALRRSQLRLALGTVVGFVVVTAALTLAIALIPAVDDIVVAGLPLSWILHAFGFYPVIIVFAVLYLRGAARNESAYRTLEDRE